MQETIEPITSLLKEEKVKKSRLKQFFKKKKVPQNVQVQPNNKPIVQNQGNQNITKVPQLQPIFAKSQTFKQVEQQVDTYNSFSREQQKLNPTQRQCSTFQKNHQPSQKQTECRSYPNQQFSKNNNYPISHKAKRILTKLQTKQTQSKQKYSTILWGTQLQKAQNKQKLNQQSQANQTQAITKHRSKISRGHYKIFNPDHFNVQNQQIKTSIHRWQFGTGQTPNNLLISSWNVNGIRARIIANDILPYLQTTKPDIFCINEHKMDEKSYLESPIKFWGYYSYWNFPKYSLGYSGVAVFSRYPAKQMAQDLHIAEHSKEGRIITLEFDKFVLVNVYIPTCGRDLQRLNYRVDEFDPAFRQYILKLKQKCPEKTLIICGDINVAHQQIDCHVGRRMQQGIQPAYTLRQRASFSLFLRQTKTVDTFRHFHPTSREYTWWNMRRGGRERAGQTGIGKRLDYFLVNRQSMKFVRTSEIKKQVKGCDHCPIELKIEFS